MYGFFIDIYQYIFSSETLIETTYDSYTKEDLFNVIKDKKYSTHEIDDNFAKFTKDVQVESTTLPGMMIEFIDSIREVVPILQPSTDKPQGITKKQRYVAPKFTLQDVQNKKSSMVNVEEHELVDYPIADSDTDFKTRDISIDEFNKALDDPSSNKDMFGFSKLMLRSLPTYYKNYFVASYNKYWRGEVDTRMNIGKATYIYKDAKKGAYEDVNSFRELIVLPNGIKHFHKILAVRLNNYIEMNKYIDKTIQKGGVRDVSHGVFEHVFKVKEVIKDANKTGKPLSIMFLDIKNAFGNINIDRLIIIMKKYQLPEQLCNYVKNFYGSLDYYMKNGKKTSELMKWKEGIIQGCPMSPTLFNLIMAYIINHINRKHLNDCGYALNSHKVMFTAFVDDLCLMCNDTECLKRVFTDLNKQLKAVGMPLSIDKTAYMQINQEQEYDVFGVSRVDVHKYLGEIINCDGSAKNSYDEFLKNLSSKFNTIELLNDSNETRIYCFKKSLMRWVNFKTKTMYDLDTKEKENIQGIVDKYIAKWGCQEKQVVFDITTPLLIESNDEVIKTMDIENMMKDYDKYEKTVDVNQSYSKKKFNMDYDTIQDGPKL
tara:strand:- start:7483 stop:9279 length:1797 start_codon:yes stop_codon:yes gene_type:complete